MTEENKWWKGGAIYQVYPRSFDDSNHDGIGDLNGITQRLDYIQSLSVDGIWISPFFPSPMKDFGYDVSDFRGIDPMFGTMDDFDRLLDEAHKRGLKIMIDLVFSHTSDQHPWFEESQKSKTGDKADYYVWADPQADGSPPTNWMSVFGGSSWTFHTGREQYYLHNFLSSQPDLNYHNPKVQEEALDIAKFWFDKGVDGFRLDTVNFYFHDKDLRNNPPRHSDANACIQYDGLWPYTMQAHVYDKSRPENIDFLERLRALCDQYDDRCLLGEIGDDTPFELSADYTKGDKRLHTAYSTAMMGGIETSLKSSDIITPITEEKSINGESWPCWAFSNHDVVRPVSRWAKNNPDHNPDFGKMLIALLSTLRGSFCLYQGEELGYEEAELQFEDLVDPWGIATWPEWQGRDGCRTPMVWDDEQLTRNIPYWLPPCDKHIQKRVSVQEEKPDSLLHFTRDFLKWRKDHPIFRHGDIRFHDKGEDVIMFDRFDDHNNFTCAFNLTDKPQVIEDVKGDVVKSMEYAEGQLNPFGFVIARA
jgi:alpha-glucosidase